MSIMSHECLLFTLTMTFFKAQLSEARVPENVNPKLSALRKPLEPKP